MDNPTLVTPLIPPPLTNRPCQPPAFIGNHRFLILTPATLPKPVEGSPAVQGGQSGALVKVVEVPFREPVACEGIEGEVSAERG